MNARFTVLTMRAMRDWIIDCVERKLPCPTNDAIAGRFDFESTSTSARLLQAMETDGMIVVERFHQSRQVTVPSIGSTLRPQRTAKHWRDRPEHSVAPVSAPPAEPAPPGKPKIKAAVIRAATLDGRDLPTFVTALIDMGLECWRDDRIESGEAVI